MAIDKSIAQAPTRTESTVTEEELRGPIIWRTMYSGVWPLS